MLAHGPDLTPTFILLAILIPSGLVGAWLGSLAIWTYHRRVMHSQRVGSELVGRMLERGYSGDEIERVLLAWHGDPEVAKKVAQPKPMKASKKELAETW